MGKAKEICDGACEGTGVVPVYHSSGDRKFSRYFGKEFESDDEKDPQLLDAWKRVEALSPSEDGIQFVMCPDCHGTGFRLGPVRSRVYRVLWALRGVQDSFWKSVVFVLPKSLVYWAVIRAFSMATTGKYSGDIPGEVSMSTVLARVYPHRGV